MGTSLDADIDVDEDDETHEINVTPFIDVMLVLLIIFMVAAPLSTVDLPVDLPSSTAVPTKRPDKPIYITIKSDLELAVGETIVAKANLIQSLDAMPEMTKDSRIFLRADRSVPYGNLMDVLELLRVGGYLRIALVALEAIPGASPSTPANANVELRVFATNHLADMGPRGACCDRPPRGLHCLRARVSAKR
jgi:biopolymer transport protein ExbD